MAGEEGGEESVSKIAESGGEQLMAINLDHSYCVWTVYMYVY